jgi:unsaturated rhamnogalacturonyl hydrolase
MLSDTARAKVLGALLAMQRHSWDQGVTAAALRDLGRPDLLRVLLDDAVARQLPDGRLGELQDVALVNCGAIGEVLHDEATRTGDVAFLAASSRQQAWLRQHAPRAADGTLFHLADLPEIWVDTVYMVVPALARCGDRAGALAQYRGYRARLRDPSTGLWRHRYDEAAGRVLDLRAWGTGNGWVVMALVRTIGRTGGDALDELIADLADTLDACLALRRADGLFGNHLDDPTSFSEATGAAMFAYAALSAATNGWLPARYGDAGRTLLASVTSALDEYGRLSPACGAPWYDRPGHSPEAQAAVLLADAAELRWVARAGDGPP